MAATVTPAPIAPGTDAAVPVVELVDVTKTFGSATVLDALHLAVAGGQIFGMIGPSGCGKTTTIRLLVGALAPSHGTVRVMGVDPQRFTTRDRERIGYTPQGFYLYPTLTVAENARFVAGLYGLGPFRRRRRIRETLKLLELWDARRRLARDISGGMQRRLALACALLHNPALLFVDEPTAGLDPVLREKIWDHLRWLRGQGTTVFVTTQYIDEAAYCDTVAIMNRGRIAAVGTPAALRQRTLGGDVVEVQAEGVTREQIVALWQIPGVNSVERTGPRGLRLRVEHGPTATPAITDLLQRHGARVAAVHSHAPDFTEVFMRIVAEHE